MSRINFSGIRDTLRTPGLAISPPDTQSAQLFGQLQEALGLGAQTVNAGIGVANAERIVQDRADAQARRNAEEANRFNADIRAEQDHQEKLKRGYGSQLSAEDEPRIENDIATRKLIRPDGLTDEQLPEFVRTHLATRLVGQSQETVDQYVKNLTPRVIAGLYKQEAAIKAESINRMAGMLRNKTSTDDTPEEITANVKTLVDMGVDEDAAYSSVVVPAMKAAAALGDAKFNTIKTALGDRFKDEQDIATAKYESELIQREKSRQDDISNHLLREIESGVPVDLVEKHLNRVVNLNQLDPNRSLPIRNNIENVRKERAKEVVKIQTESVRQQYELEAVQTAHTFASSREPGRGLYMMQNQERELPDGTKWKMNAADVAQQVTDQAVSRFAERFADQPQTALANQVDFVSRNKVIPSQWKALLNNADTDASINSVLLPAQANRGQSSGPIAIPPNLRNAFELYRRIRAISPPVAEQAVTSTSAGKLYDLAEAAMSLPEYGGDSGRAMTAAIRVANDSTWWQTMEVNRDPINDAISDLPSHNAGYVQRYIERNAKLYMQLNGISDEKAVENAVKSLKATHSLINGAYVETSRSDVGDEGFLKQALSMVARNYARLNTDEKLDAKDLYFQHDSAGNWYLHRTDTNQHVENINRGEGSFTSSDLRKLVSSTQLDPAQAKVQRERAVREAAATAKIIKANSKTAAERQIENGNLLSITTP